MNIVEVTCKVHAVNVHEKLFAWGKATRKKFRQGCPCFLGLKSDRLLFFGFLKMRVILGGFEKISIIFGGC